MRLWRIEDSTKELICIMHKHSNRVRTMAFSSNGDRLVSSGEDGVIMHWDIPSGNLITEFKCDGPYERMDITGLIGLTEAQKSTLQILGAIEAKAEIQAISCYTFLRSERRQIR